MSKPSTFRPGDVVRRINQPFGEFHPGDLGVVVEGEMTSTNVRVKHSDSGSTRGMQPWNLELVERAPDSSTTSASATRTTVEERVETVRLREVVVLTLTQEEADTLRTVLRFVGGCPHTSRRRHASAVAAALDKAGCVGSEADVGRPRGGVYFTEAPRRGLESGDC